MFSKVTVPIHNPSKNIEKFRLLYHILTTYQDLALPVLLNLIHYSGYVVCHSDFNFYFLKNEISTFTCAYMSFIYLLCKCLVKSLLPIFELVCLVKCKGSLYIPDISYSFLFCKYFLPLCSLPFHFFILSFGEQRFWILKKSNSFFFFLFD